MTVTVCGVPFDAARIALFWKKVDKETADPCWLWTATPGTSGYGNFRAGIRMLLPHRVAYELAKGPIGAELEVRHGPCCNPLCVNPDHLTVGTRKQNVEDRYIGWGRFPLEEWPITAQERADMELINAWLIESGLGEE